MTATLNFEVRQHMRTLYPENRWGVLTVLLLHADIRNRCWPSVDTIAFEMAISPTKVSKAKKWLLEHKAIEIVPYEQRIDAEKKAGPRQHVYQLTGIVEIDGKSIPYLYIHGPSTAAQSNPSDHSNFNPSNAGNTAVERIDHGNLSISNSKIDTLEEENTKTLAPASPAPTTETPKVSSDNRPSPVENARADGKPTVLKEASKNPSKVPKKVPAQHAEIKVMIHRYGFDDANSRATWARANDVATALLEDDPSVTPADFQSFADDWIALSGKPSFPCGTDSLPTNYAKWKVGRNGNNRQSNAENAAERQRGNTAELERVVIWDDDGPADSPGTPRGLPAGNRSAA